MGDSTAAGHHSKTTNTLTEGEKSQEFDYLSIFDGFMSFAVIYCLLSRPREFRMCSSLRTHPINSSTLQVQLHRLPLINFQHTQRSLIAAENRREKSLHSYMQLRFRNKSPHRFISIERSRTKRSAVHYREINTFISMDSHK
jgi:hypothetical protein